MDWPSPIVQPPVISTTMMYAESVGSYQAAQTFASAVWPTANLAIFTPFTLWSPYLIRMLWWANGAGAAGNIDCGIYSRDGTKIMSTGSTAQAGTTIVQTVNVTDILLTPGSYYMAIAASSTSSTFQRCPIFANTAKFVGMAQQASALPLPATFTLVTAANSYLPLCGFTNRTVI